MITQTKDTQDKLTSDIAHALLREGNERFVQNVRTPRDLKEQVQTTSRGQYPFAVVLSCIDSRAPVELVFDQGIGDVFSIRVAGNVVNEDVLGSMEYACGVAGSKIAVVMGHTRCGAVTAACKNVEMGNITSLLSKIGPAVDRFRKENVEMDEETIEQVAVQHVRFAIEAIRKQSSILSDMEREGKIKIVGAIYSVSTGQVSFL